MNHRTWVIQVSIDCNWGREGDEGDEDEDDSILLYYTVSPIRAKPLYDCG